MLRDIVAFQANARSDQFALSKMTSHYGNQFLPGQPPQSNNQVKLLADLKTGGIYKLRRRGVNGETSINLIFGGFYGDDELIFHCLNEDLVLNAIIFSNIELCLAKAPEGWVNWSWIEEI